VAGEAGAGFGVDQVKGLTNREIAAINWQKNSKYQAPMTKQISNSKSQ
jgi:hypothetical protein